MKRTVELQVICTLVLSAGLTLSCTKEPSSDDAESRADASASGDVVADESDHADGGAAEDSSTSSTGSVPTEDGGVAQQTEASSRDAGEDGPDDLDSGRQVGGDSGPIGIADAAAARDSSAPPSDATVSCAGSFTITVTCVSGPCAQQTYVHTYDVVWNGSSFTGTGWASEGSTVFEEEISGQLSDGSLQFQSVYTTVVPGYTIEGQATLAADHTASGTGNGVDPRGAQQEFTLEISSVDPDCTSATATDASSDSGVDEAVVGSLTGTWSVLAVVPSGAAHAGTYPGVWELVDTSDGVEGNGAWASNAGDANSSLSGSRSGRSVSIARVDTTGFRGTFEGVVSEDGLSMTGTGENDPSSPLGNAAAYTWTAQRLKACDISERTCLQEQNLGGSWQCPGNSGVTLTVSATGRFDFRNGIGQHARGCMSCDGLFEGVSTVDSGGTPRMFVYVNGSLVADAEEPGTATLNWQYCGDTSDLAGCRSAPTGSATPDTCTRVEP